MHYLIEYDTRLVIGKSPMSSKLRRIISDKGLELASAIVSNPEELVIKFSIDEMTDIHNNISDKPVNDKLNEVELSEVTWHQLSESKINKVMSNIKVEKPEVKSNYIYELGSEKPLTSFFVSLVEFIDDNLGEVTHDELVGFVESTHKGDFDELIDFALSERIIIKKGKEK